MITTFALHPAASKYLIGQAVARLPEIESAMRDGKILIGAGTTNIMVAQALLGTVCTTREPYVAGVITQRAPCVTEGSQRLGPWLLERGMPVGTNWLDFLDSMKPGDVVVKGANAYDPAGMIGILLGDATGGTIGKTIGAIKARGIQLIAPIGLEKLVPSCVEAEKWMQEVHPTAPRLGIRSGYIAVSNAKIITEIDSLNILMGVESCQIAAGGVGGMEGCVVLASRCRDEKHARELLEMIKRANRTAPIRIKRQSCKNCQAPCYMQERHP